ncbi:MAG: hypothetical protein QOC86_3059 [Gaiellales bacterium]|nr:hypothetical protein [Gaiellales bacterium]
MERRQDGRTTDNGREDLAATLGDPEIAPDDRLGRRGTEQDQQIGLDDLHLEVEPRPAGPDLGCVRALVKAPLAAGPPLEVLDHVADEDALSVNARLIEGRVEEAAGRPDEWPTLEVLPVARLLADEHERRVLPTLAEDRPGRSLPEVARLAARGLLTSSLEARGRWDMERRMIERKVIG